MPSGSYKQAYVQCPFYKFDDGQKRITCEGLIDDSSLALIYHKKADYETQITVFCCEHYKKCEVYRMLMDKYEEENLFRSMKHLAEMQWIPVTERLPKIGSLVIACGEKGGVFVVKSEGIRTGFGRMDGTSKYRSFTHWMPAPEPPKGE